MFFAGGNDPDAGRDDALPGELKFPASQFVRVVDEDDRAGVFAVLMQRFALFVLFEFFPGLAVVEVEAVLLGVPPLGHGGMIAPGREGTEGVEEERIRFDFCAPDFAGVFV